MYVYADVYTKGKDSSDEIRIIKVVLTRAKEVIVTICWASTGCQVLGTFLLKHYKGVSSIPIL